jgi:hypothetical protein
MASTPQRTISQRAVIAETPIDKAAERMSAAACARVDLSPAARLKWRGHCQKRFGDATLENAGTLLAS